MGGLNLDPQKIAISVALASGLVGAGAGLTADDSDRFTATDFKREITLRDTEIKHLRQYMEQHLEHSATYTQRIHDMDRRVRLCEGNHDERP